MTAIEVELHGGPYDGTQLSLPIGVVWAGLVLGGVGGWHHYAADVDPRHMLPGSEWAGELVVTYQGAVQPPIP